MHILLTGFSGNVGTNTLAELVARGHDVRAVDLPCRRAFAASRGVQASADFRYGDLRDRHFATEILDGIDCVTHLAAVIPPKAEQDHELARRSTSMPPFSSLS